MSRIIVYIGRCIGCGDCVEKCGTQNLIVDQKTNHIKPVRGVISLQRFEDRIEYEVPGCATCRYCEITCKQEAIKIET